MIDDSAFIFAQSLREKKYLCWCHTNTLGTILRRFPHKYMEYMTMLDAAYEPYICQIYFFYWDLYLKQFTDSMDSME